MPREPRIKLFYAVVTLFWMALYAYQPLLANHAAALGADAVTAGAVLSAYGLTQLVLRIPLGILSDAVKKRKLFVIMGAVLGLASAVGLFFARTPVQLVVFRALAGASASAWVVFTVLFSAYHSPQQAARAMARVTVFNNLGQIVAMVLGGQLAQLLGSSAAFALAAVLGVAATVLALGITEKIPDHPPQKISALLKVGLNGKLLTVSCIGILYQMVSQGATLGFVPTYAKTLGATDGALGILTALSVGGMMCASLLAGNVLLKKMKPMVCVCTGLCITGTCTVLMPVLGTKLWVLMALQMAGGFGGGLTFPLLMGQAIEDIAPEKRGAAMGFFQSIYAVGMFIGPLLTGFLIERFSLQTSLMLVGCISFTALLPALGFLFFRGKTRRSC